MQLNESVNRLKDVLKDMANHIVKVTLPKEREERELYLVVIMVKVSPFDEFQEIYGKQASPLHLVLAKKIYPNVEEEREFGVFFDLDGKMVFAFPRDFVSYDAKSESIILNDLDVMFSEVLSGQIFPEIKPGIKFDPQSLTQRQHDGPIELKRVVLKYAATRLP